MPEQWVVSQEVRVLRWVWWQHKHTSDQKPSTQQFQAGVDRPPPSQKKKKQQQQCICLYKTQLLDQVSDSGICSKLYSDTLPTRPRKVAAAAYDFTERAAADESACSDYKSAALLMRWEDTYWHTEEQGSKEEQQRMQLI